MRKSSFFGIFLAILFNLGCANVGFSDPKEAVAPTSASAKNETSYGLLDMQRVILSVDEGKKARTELEKKIKVKEEEMLGKKKELDKLNEDWKQQSAIMSEDARTRKQKDFQDKVMELRNAEMAFQNEIKKEEAQATQKIAMKVAKMVERISKDKNLDLVFEANSSGLLYVKNPIDLTEQIIKDYEKFNVASGQDKKTETKSVKQ